MTKTTTPAGTIYGLYCRCHPEAKVRYVGQTSQRDGLRFKDHKKSARKGNADRVGRLPVYRWMRKHGVDNIAYTVLETTSDVSTLDALEVKWIEQMKTLTPSGFNMSAGGNGQRGFTHSLETRQKMALKKRLAPIYSGRASTTPDRVALVKLDLWNGATVRETADKYGVSVKVVKDISQSKSWLHVSWPIGPRQRMRTSELLSKNATEHPRDERGRLKKKLSLG